MAAAALTAAGMVKTDFGFGDAASAAAAPGGAASASCCDGCAGRVGEPADGVLSAPRDGPGCGPREFASPITPPANTYDARLGRLAGTEADSPQSGVTSTARSPHSGRPNRGELDPASNEASVRAEAEISHSPLTDSPDGTRLSRPCWTSGGQQPADPDSDTWAGRAALIYRWWGDADAQAAAWVVPHSCQNERASTVTNGHSGDVRGHDDLDSGCYWRCLNKPDPKIGELVGARQHPAERSGAG
jgi:hypothetical protein